MSPLRLCHVRVGSHHESEGFGFHQVDVQLRRLSREEFDQRRANAVNYFKDHARFYLGIVPSIFKFWFRKQLASGTRFKTIPTCSKHYKPHMQKLKHRSHPQATKLAARRLASQAIQCLRARSPRPSISSVASPRRPGPIRRSFFTELAAVNESTRAHSVQRCYCISINRFL